MTERSDIYSGTMVPKRASSRIGIVTLMILLLGAISTQDFSVLELKDPDILPNMLIALSSAAAIALFLELAVGVLLSIICGPQETAQAATEAAIAKAEAKAILREKTVLESLTTPEERMAFLTEGGSADRMAGYAFSDPDRAQKQGLSNARRKIEKQYLATVLLTLFGGAIAICGFRLLAMIFSYDTTGVIEAHQMTAIGLLDIALTTLVLGGGAAGIHDLISKLRSAQANGGVPA